MTQNEQVLNYMREKGSITAWQAAYDLGCFRLSARIHDLKADGYQIKSDTVVIKDSRGEYKHFARYSLGEEK